MKKFGMICVSALCVLAAGCVSTQADSEKISFHKETAAPSAAADAYGKRLADITLRITSAPSRTAKNGAFNAPYTLAVTDAAGNAVADFPVTLTYPADKKDDEVRYVSKEARTDGAGTVTFMPEKPTFAADARLTFQPLPPSAARDIVRLAEQKAVSAPWRVYTDYLNSAGMLYVFDYNADGRPRINSFAFLQTLRTSGFSRMGNAPLSTASYLDGPASEIYRRTKAIVGDAYAVMISGTVKYTQPVERTENGYRCTLTAAITCISMRDGSELYGTADTHSVIAESEAEADKKCRKELAERVVQKLLYSL